MTTERIRQRRRKITAALTGAALLATGCGSSDTSQFTQQSEPPADVPATPDSGAASESQPAAASWGEGLDESAFAPEVVTTVDALFATHGDAALEVLLYSLERGYSAEQIERAAVDGAIAGDGVFTDGTTPDGSPAGVIELPDGEKPSDGDGADEESVGVQGGPMALRSAPADEAPLTVDRLRQVLGSKANAPDEVLALLIVGLARDGYSLEQITDSIVLGTGLPIPTPEFGVPHVCLFDPDGVLIKPEVPIGDNAICTDRTIGNAPGSEPPASDAAPATADDNAVAAGQTEWSIEIPPEPTTDDEFGVTTYEPTKILITRTPGTDTFIMSTSTGRTNVDDRYTDDGFNEITCTREFGEVYTGTGTFDTTYMNSIVFVGELFLKDVITDCSGADNSVSWPDWEITVFLDPEGLSGFHPAEFLIPGETPAPIGG